MTMDISNFYLMTPLKRPEYIRISINDIPEEIIVEYKLREKADSKGMVFIQANRGMYGLPQSGLLANEPLEKRLNKRGYHQSKLVPARMCQESAQTIQTQGAKETKPTIPKRHHQVWSKEAIC